MQTFYRMMLLASPLAIGPAALAQEPAQDQQAQAEPSAPRGSLIEDRAARRLLAAGDARVETDEIPKAVEIWQSVVERYPASAVRFEAHLRLGRHFLERARAFDQARVHFEAAQSEENRDQEQRAEALLKTGVCYYHDRDYGKCFRAMRDVVERFPVSSQVNDAYYYIGLGHFQLGHYSRAIEALEKVGAALVESQGGLEKLEAGRRLFVKIDDADLAILGPEETVDVRCTSSGGDTEIVRCYPVGRDVRVVLGSISTQLGSPVAENGVLEIKGGDAVEVAYVDRHTAEKELDRRVLRKVAVVGNGRVRITDGAYHGTLQGVVLGKPLRVQITDADLDRSDKADSLPAAAEVYRRKSAESLEDEAAAAASAPAPSGESPEAAPTEAGEADAVQADAGEADEWELIDRVEFTLTEAPAAPTTEDTAAAETTAAVATASPVAIHSGAFRGSVLIEHSSEVKAGDEVLQAQPDDVVRVIYQDEYHRGEGPRPVIAEARCLEGNIGGVRVARAMISDQELRIQTMLNTADALTQIGNRYQEFGLQENAQSKYVQAVEVCEEVMDEAQKLGGSVLEQAYVQLWRVYFAMDQIHLAARMCERLQREFPNSGFVDDALLQVAQVASKEGDLERAIGIYSRLVRMQTSSLRGDAQFGIAECYQQMAEAADDEERQARQYADRAFQEYKKVFDQFPESGRVGEAVAKMANYYYQQQDYRRAIDTFESVLSDYPDAQFIDVILFNYGRCLYRMDRKDEARRRFEQVIGDYPESELAGDAKQIVAALVKAGF